MLAVWAGQARLLPRPLCSAAGRLHAPGGAAFTAWARRGGDSPGYTLGEDPTFTGPRGVCSSRGFLHVPERWNAILFAHQPEVHTCCPKVTLVAQICALRRASTPYIGFRRGFRICFRKPVGLASNRGWILHHKFYNMPIVGQSIHPQTILRLNFVAYRHSSTCHQP